MGRNKLYVGPGSAYTPQIGEAFCAHIAAGKTIADIVKLSGMPSVGTLANWKRLHAEFYDKYREAQRFAAMVYASESLAAARQVFQASMRCPLCLGKKKVPAHKRITKERSGEKDDYTEETVEGFELSKGLKVCGMCLGTGNNPDSKTVVLAYKQLQQELHWQAAHLQPEVFSDHLDHDAEGARAGGVTKINIFLGGNEAPKVVDGEAKEIPPNPEQG